MGVFTILYNQLDQTTRATEKVAALKRYLSESPPEDAAWAIYLLSGRKFPRAVSTSLLREWAAERAELPLWLLEESYKTVGDLSETLAIILPDAERQTELLPLHVWIEQRLLPLRNLSDPEKRALIEQSWSDLAEIERIVYNKLLTGMFRSPASHAVLEQALAQHAGLPQTVVAERLADDWEPSAEAFYALIGESRSPAGQEVPTGGETAPVALPPGCHTVLAVLLYVQVERPNRPAEYTFALWDKGALVPVAKISSGIADKDRKAMDRHARLNTTERFGPVRAVAPALTAEITFDDVSLSTRHKSGVSIKSPRLFRLRDDLQPDQAGSLESLRQLASTT